MPDGPPLTNGPFLVYLFRNEMPWTCPACRLPISHSETEAHPRKGVTYRCHVCRLELIVDPADGRLVLAPLAAGEADHGHEARPDASAGRAATRITVAPRRARVHMTAHDRSARSKASQNRRRRSAK